MPWRRGKTHAVSAAGGTSASKKTAAAALAKKYRQHETRISSRCRQTCRSVRSPRACNLLPHIRGTFLKKAPRYFSASLQPPYQQAAPACGGKYLITAADSPEVPPSQAYSAFKCFMHCKKNIPWRNSIPDNMNIRIRFLHF